MRPVPISDADLAQWTHGRRVTLGAPVGMEDTVRPIEAVVDLAGPAAYSLKIMLEPGDLEALTADGHCWLTMLGGVVPFTFDVPGITRPVVVTDDVSRETPDDDG